jgi:hypothetical protein
VGAHELGGWVMAIICLGGHELGLDPWPFSTWLGGHEPSLTNGHHPLGWVHVSFVCKCKSKTSVLRAMFFLWQIFNHLVTKNHS